MNAPSPYDSLPDQTPIQSADGVADGIVQQRMRHNEVPAIAPKMLLRSPLWLAPQAATAKVGPGQPRIHYRREYTDLTPQGKAFASWCEVATFKPADGNEGGLLRWFDLDVTMALTLAWTRSQSPEVEIAQRDLFRWMGYTRKLREPYEELQGSLDRLKNCQVGIGAPSGDTEEFRIVTEGRRITGTGKGNPTFIRARLADIWYNALQEGTWQAVDLRMYAEVVRQFRSVGLARAIYLYLASWRDQNMAFTIPVWSLQQRYGQVRTDGRFRYADPFNPKGTLRKALQALHDAGVMALNAPSTTDTNAMLSGRFLPPTKPMVTIPNQTTFIAPGMWDGQPQIQTEQPAAIAYAPTPASTPEPQADLAPQLQRVRKLIYDLTVSSIKRWQKQGWSDSQLSCLLFWCWWADRHDYLGTDQQGRSVTAARRAGHLVKDGDPTEWTKAHVANLIKQTQHYAAGDPFDQAIAEFEHLENTQS